MQLNAPSPKLTLEWRDVLSETCALLKTKTDRDSAKGDANKFLGKTRRFESNMPFHHFF